MNKRLAYTWNRFGRHLAKYSAYYVIALLLLMLLAIVLPLTVKRLELLEQIGISQLVCGVLTLFVIFITLALIMRQLAVSEAKPKLSLAFDEVGTTEVTLEVIEGQEKQHDLQLWMTNCGDAVAKEWQVDVDTDAVLTASLHPPWPDQTTTYDPRRSANAGMLTISFSNLVCPCFVDRPVRVMTLALWTRADSYDKYPRESKIAYRIYGTWGQEQSGELKVRLNRIPGA